MAVDFTLQGRVTSVSDTSTLGQLQVGDVIELRSSYFGSITGVGRETLDFDETIGLDEGSCRIQTRAYP
jgi:hypothetical protein